jgi:hypothetical protein
MRKLIIAALVMFVFVSPEVNAVTPLTVEQVRSYCMERRGTAGEAVCLGMVDGVSNTLLAYRQICGKGYISNPQSIQIFLNWANANPTKWQIVGAYGVIHALTEAFPCK